MPDPNPKKRINDLELTVRTIEDLLPEMPTSGLQKWQGILRTTLAKVEKELTATKLHTCRLCFFEEWGYRDELPSFWYGKGDSVICFQHTYEEADKELKSMGEETDAFLPPDIAPTTVEGLKVHMEKNLPPPKTSVDQDLDELMAMI